MPPCSRHSPGLMAAPAARAESSQPAVHKKGRGCSWCLRVCSNAQKKSYGVRYCCLMALLFAIGRTKGKSPRRLDRSVLSIVRVTMLRLIETYEVCVSVDTTDLREAWLFFLECSRHRDRIMYRIYTERKNEFWTKTLRLTALRLS